MRPDSSSQSRMAERYADLLDGADSDELAEIVAVLDMLCEDIKSPALQSPIVAGAEGASRSNITGARWRGVSERRREQEDSDVDAEFPHTPVALPVAKRRKSRRLISEVAAIAAVLLIAMLARTLFGVLKSSPGSPNLGKGTQTELFSISMVSPDEGWAVGGQTWYAENDPNPGTMVLYHYKNGQWTPTYIPFNDPNWPDSAYPVLRSVSMVSADDGWAVGATTNGSIEGFFLHYDGTTWHIVKPIISPSEERDLAPNNVGKVPAFTDISQVQMLAADDGWAVSGDSSQHGGWAIYHYNGTSWRSVPVADPSCHQVPPANIPAVSATPDFDCAFTGIAMSSLDEGWAVGRSGQSYSFRDTKGKTITADTTTGVVFHYVGGQWHLQASFPHVIFNAVTMVSPDEGWAVGVEYTPGDPNNIETPFLVHYSDGKWQHVTSPLDTLPGAKSYIGTFSSVSADSVWLAESLFDTQDKMAHGHTTTLLHYNGKRWEIMPLPVISDRIAYHITSLAMLPSGDGWAVGGTWWPSDTGQYDRTTIGLNTTATPLILHYHNGSWSVYTS